MSTPVLERPTATAVGDATHPHPSHPTIHVLRHAQIERERYEDLLALPTDQLRRQAAADIRAELALPVERQREAIHTRLSAWLDMDPEDARILARVWDEGITYLPEDDARRRYEAECDAMLHGFSFRDFTRIAKFMPWVQSRLGMTLFARHTRTEAA